VKVNVSLCKTTIKTLKLTLHDNGDSESVHLTIHSMNDSLQSSSYDTALLTWPSNSITGKNQRPQSVVLYLTDSGFLGGANGDGVNFSGKYGKYCLWE